MLRIAIILAAALVAMPAMADAPRVASFSHGGQAVALPLPTGYCLPQSERELRFANNTAAGDPDSNTLLVLVRCDNTFDPATLDYTLVKSPSKGVLATLRISRADLIKSMKTFLASNPNIAALNAKSDTKASGAASKLLGDDVNISSIMGPRGSDSDCVYIGGIMSVTFGEKSVPLIAGECMTSVNDQVIAVLRYRVGSDLSVLPALLAEARAIIVSMKSSAGA